MHTIETILGNITKERLKRYREEAIKAHEQQIIPSDDYFKIEDLLQAVGTKQFDLARSIIWNEGDTIFRERLRWLLLYTNEKYKFYIKGANKEYKIVAAHLIFGKSTEQELAIIKTETSRDKALASYLTQNNLQYAIPQIHQGCVKVDGVRLYSVPMQ